MNGTGVLAFLQQPPHNGQSLPGTDSGETNISVFETKFASYDSELFFSYPGKKDTFKKLLDHLNLYLLPIVVAVGIFGNLSAVVVLQKSLLKLRTCSLLLAFRCIVDTGLLVCIFIIWLPRVDVLLFHTIGFCQIVSYLNHVFCFLSSWSLVGLTMEKYLNLWHPKTAERWCTKKGVAIGLVIITLLGCVILNFALWTNKVLEINKTPICMPNPDLYDALTVLKIVNLCCSFLLPMIISIILMTCIGLKFLYYRRVFREYSKQLANSISGIAHFQSSSSVFKATMSNNGRIRFTFYKSARRCDHCSKGQRNRNNVNKTRFQIEQGLKQYHIKRNLSKFECSKLLVGFTFLFVLTGMPTNGFQLRSLVITLTGQIYSPTRLYLNLQQLFEMIFFLNFTSNFVLLLIFSENFRNVLFRMVQHCCKSHKNRPSMSEESIL